MRIQTPVFGEIEIDPQQVVTFANGIPGFEHETEYVFIPLEDSPFVVMQSVQSMLHFIVTDPFPLFSDYHFELSDGDIEHLEVQSQEDVLVYNIVVLREDISQSTINMQAPLVLNVRTKKGKQIVLNQYQVRQPLFPGASVTHVTKG